MCQIATHRRPRAYTAQRERTGTPMEGCALNQSCSCANFRRHEERTVVFGENTSRESVANGWRRPSNGTSHWKPSSRWTCSREQVSKANSSGFYSISYPSSRLSGSLSIPPLPTSSTWPYSHHPFSANGFQPIPVFWVCSSLLSLQPE